MSPTLTPAPSPRQDAGVHGAIQRCFALRLLIVAAFAVAFVIAAGLGRAGTSLANSGYSASASVRATAITAGVSHTCALTSAGGVACWGYNGHDELGTGRGDNLSSSSTPVGVSGLSDRATAVSAGVRHSCALTSAGGVKCWGANYSGALGDGTTDRHFAPVDVSGLSNGVTAVAAGYDGSCALISTGGVKCWGRNDYGQRGDGTTEDRFTPVDVSGLSGVTAIATLGVQSCALTTTGGVKCWGFNYGLTPVDVPGLSSGVIAITTGCALTSAGGVKCWVGDYGPTPVDIPGLNGVIAIAGSGLHGCALTSVGGVKCWGLNDHGQLGDGTTVDRSTPVGVSGLGSGVTAISAGGFHTCAVTRTGSAKCWGTNFTGELGDGTTHERRRPVGVLGLGAKTTLAIVSGSVSVTPARVAPIKLRCGAQARCRGTLTLTASIGVKLGSRGLSIAAGRTQAVRVTLGARGFELLVRVKRLSARVRITYKQSAGGTTTATRTITLIAPQSAKRSTSARSTP